MLAALLLLTSTFITEAANSIGKQSVRYRRENIYDLAFLNFFWGFIFLLVTIPFGAPVHFNPASLPMLGVRIIVELLLAYVSAEAIIAADRSTLGFLRLLTIPLLLVIDIALGYRLSTVQLVAFRHNQRGHRGAWAAILSAILAAVAVSLYKYDITHYNSVVVDQGIVLAAMLMVFYAMARRRGRSPLKLLVRRVTGTQALANGLVIPLESFAVGLAPASVIITLKRSLGLGWCIVFGGLYFHEHSLRRKLSSAVLMAVSLVLITAPQIVRL
jgi:hypothetical protein